MGTRFRYGIMFVFPAQFLTIAAALVGIATLGYYVPSWDVWWYTKFIDYPRVRRWVLGNPRVEK